MFQNKFQQLKKKIQQRLKPKARKGGLFLESVSRAGWVGKVIEYFAVATNILAAWLIPGLEGLAKLLMLLISGLINVIVAVLVISSQYNNFINEPAIIEAWGILRDITNMFFILMFLVMAVGTILKNEKYSWQKMLIPLALMAIFVNFSRTICGLIIDFSQVVMLTFVNAFKDIAGGNLIRLFGLNDFYSWEVVKGLGAGVGSTSINSTQGIALLLLGAFLAFIALVIFTIVAVILLIRIIALWFLIILSPIAFLFYVIPGTQKYAQQWQNAFFKNVISGPVIAFFIWVAFLILEKSEKTSVIVPQDVPEGTMVLPLLGTPDLYINFILGGGLLIAGLLAAKTISAAGANFAGQGIGLIQKVGGTTAAKIAKAPLGAAKFSIGAGVDKIKELGGPDLNFARSWRRFKQAREERKNERMMGGDVKSKELIYKQWHPLLRVFKGAFMANARPDTFAKNIWGTKMFGILGRDLFGQSEAIQQAEAARIRDNNQILSRHQMQNSQLAENSSQYFHRRAEETRGEVEANKKIQKETKSDLAEDLTEKELKGEKRDTGERDEQGKPIYETTPGYQTEMRSFEERLFADDQLPALIKKIEAAEEGSTDHQAAVQNLYNHLISTGSLDGLKAVSSSVQYQAGLSDQEGMARFVQSILRLPDKQREEQENEGKAREFDTLRAGIMSGELRDVSSQSRYLQLAAEANEKMESEVGDKITKATKRYDDEKTKTEKELDKLNGNLKNLETQRRLETNKDELERLDKMISLMKREKEQKESHLQSLDEAWIGKFLKDKNGKMIKTVEGEKDRLEKEKAQIDRFKREVLGGIESKNIDRIEARIKSIKINEKGEIESGGIDIDGLMDDKQKSDREIRNLEMRQLIKDNADAKRKMTAARLPLDFEARVAERQLTAKKRQELEGVESAEELFDSLSSALATKDKYKFKAIMEKMAMDYNDNEFLNYFGFDSGWKGLQPFSKEILQNKLGLGDQTALRWMTDLSYINESRRHWDTARITTADEREPGRLRWLTEQEHVTAALTEMLKMGPRENVRDNNRLAYGGEDPMLRKFEIGKLGLAFFLSMPQHILEGQLAHFNTNALYNLARPETLHRLMRAGVSRGTLRMIKENAGPISAADASRKAA